ncbi:MAG: DUF4214 domain-containing protein, partial [Candidatus Accumulibacter sp.]|nr:DUF4214 domain-containing protein [Accumulibacter sp.]
MALVKLDIQKVYIALFKRPADAEGLNYWGTQYPGDSIAELIAQASTEPEYTSEYEGLSTGEFIDKIYQNLFARVPDLDGRAYWINQVETQGLSRDGAAYYILEGATTLDKDIIDNKAEAADYFTTLLNTEEKVDAYANAGANNAGNLAKEWLAAIGSDKTTLEAAKNEGIDLVQQLVDAAEEGGSVTPPPVDDGEIWVGTGARPEFNGTDGNNTFYAGLSGLTDDTVVDGKGGTDTLTINLDSDKAIAPTVKNVETIITRVQRVTATAGNGDNNIVNTATIDADRFSGVTRWENNHSRADLKIEDVRIDENRLTSEVTIAFKESDPGHVDYALYFDQSSLRNVTTDTDTLKVAILDNYPGNSPLQNNTYNGLRFNFDGQFVTLNFDTVKGTSTP